MHVTFLNEMLETFLDSLTRIKTVIFVYSWRNGL